MFERTSAHLVQPSGQHRIRWGARPGCPGFYPLESWKAQELETTQQGSLLHWWTVLMVGTFSLDQIRSSQFNLSLLALIVPACTFMKSTAPPPRYFPGDPVRSFQSHFFSRLNKPWLWISAQRMSDLLTACCPLDLWLCCIAEPKALQYSGRSLMSAA